MNFKTFPTSPTLLLPSLKLLGYETGFSIRNPVLFQGSNLPSEDYSLRVTTLREGVIKDQQELCFKKDQYLTAYLSDKQSLNTEQESSELYCVNYISGSPTKNPKGGAFRDLEAEWRFRSARTTGKILTGMVPYRQIGYRFAPIIHLAHYMICSESVESYICLANLNISKLAPDTSAEQNVFSVDVFSLKGIFLGSFDQEVPFNSTFLMSAQEILKKTNSVLDGERAFSVLIRGGKSQFTIYTLFLNKESGAIGGEHSLAPAYYTDAVKSASFRETFYKNALRKI